jgi:hypothetical protein
VKKVVLHSALAVMAALHQDFWFWRDATLVFGLLPVGLFYHACYTVGAALLMWLLAQHCWPSHLEAESQPGGKPGREHL